MIEISVIVPTYKPKEYIWECLNSLNCQTIDKSFFEVILVLNGCKEPWHSEIKAWMAQHPALQINLVQTDFSGVSNARNIGIKHSRGRYITFIDDDDYVSETYLEGLLSQTSVDKNAVVLSNAVSFTDGSNTYNESYSLRKIYYRLKNGNTPITLFHARSLFNGPCMKLFPNSILQGEYFDTRFKNSEDALYIYQISKNFRRILLTSEDSVYYRRFRTDSAINKKKSNSYVVRTQLKFIRAIIKIYLSDPFKYSLPFTFSRIMAGFKTIYLQLTR